MYKTRELCDKYFVSAKKVAEWLTIIFFISSYWKRNSFRHSMHKYFLSNKFLTSTAKQFAFKYWNVALENFVLMLWSQQFLILAQVLNYPLCHLLRVGVLPLWLYSDAIWISFDVFGILFLLKFLCQLLLICIHILAYASKLFMLLDIVLKDEYYIQKSLGFHLLLLI